MLCAVCNSEVERGKAYCAECQVRTDDFLFAGSVRLRRFCGACKNNSAFESVNDRVVRCASCGVFHEVEDGRSK